MRVERYPTSDEFYFLCLLHNIGATSSDTSLNIKNISQFTTIDLKDIEKNLENLINKKYINLIHTDDNKRYYVNIQGIRKVLSMYS
jgi:hypothetical protein